MPGGGGLLAGVSYLHCEIAAAVVDTDSGPRLPRVLDHIGQRFLDDTECRQVYAWRQTLGHVAGVQLDR